MSWRSAARVTARPTGTRSTRWSPTGFLRRRTKRQGVRRDERHRRLQLGGRCPVDIAADIVLRRSRRHVARSEAVGRKIPHQLRAAEETVEQRQLLAAPRSRVAALRVGDADYVAEDLMVVADVLGGAREFGGAAEAGKFVVRLNADAVRRVLGIVERRVGHAGADRRDPHRPGRGRLLNGKRGGAERGIEREALTVDRIAPAQAELVVDRRAGGNLGAVDGAVIGLIAAGESLFAEQIDAERKPRTERIGVGQGNVEAPDILPDGCRQPRRVAGA